ncbi:hypothetical protein PIB30_100323 [Stylosanthes scabra]|uniref:Uncharacterized protein n=1 Tax=Stylosanthes scabra TaxID=79078 RepID=A0ABU6QZM5_9FABA|nr:hypothetical protein [Stylosanthes scabra]
MSTHHHLLHYMMTYVLLPRKGNHGTVNEEYLIILWAMVKKHEINWPYLITHKLLTYAFGQLGPGLGHDMLWTKVFEYLGIDLSGEEVVAIGDGNAITHKHLNQMRRNLNVAGAENVADEAANEDVPYQPGVSLATQFPPKLMEAFSQGVQTFHSEWGGNFQRVGRRLDGFEARLISRANET